MLEGIKYDNRPVESVFQADMADGTKHHQVMVTYGDELEPKTEIMSEEEWTAMQQKTEDEHHRTFYLADATYPLRKRILNEFENYNPRLIEMSKITVRIGDDLRQLITALYNVAFKKQDYIGELSAKEVLESYKMVGKEPDFGALDEKHKKVLEVLAEQEIPVEAYVFFIKEIQQQVEFMRDTAIGNIVGIPLANIRVDNVVQYLEKNAPELVKPVLPEVSEVEVPKIELEPKSE